jgi:hypothetical protein
MDLSSGWTVTFGKDGKPAPMDTLRSWTDSEDTRYFSGVAAYERKVTIPDTFLASGLQVNLDFGQGKPNNYVGPKNGYFTQYDAPVRDAAVVYVNGKRAGATWCPPYAVEISGFLKSGENQIRVEVGNLAVNYMAGRKLPDYRLLTLRYGDRFQPQDMDRIKAEPSGLLGPIRLVATQK